MEVFVLEAHSIVLQCNCVKKIQFMALLVTVLLYFYYINLASLHCVKVKVNHAPQESIGGCSSPSPSPWARRWKTTNVCDAWPVQRRTYGYLPRLHRPLAGTKLYCLVTETRVLITLCSCTMLPLELEYLHLSYHGIGSVWTRNLDYFPFAPVVCC